MTEELEFVPTGIKNDAGEEIFLVLNEYGRGDHNQAYVKRGDTWLRTRYPDFMSHEVETSSSNPYKKVWNNVQKEEQHFQEQAKNGVLFIPTVLELARRHAATARWFLHRARKANSTGDHAVAQEHFAEALIYRNMAKNEFIQHERILRLSR